MTKEEIIAKIEANTEKERQELVAHWQAEKDRALEGKLYAMGTKKTTFTRIFYSI